jgi:2-keto-4-pentenoate hydratase/2-oxohepta-3-ene-1,7-dioic acid hydratase in catechol pathway
MSGCLVVAALLVAAPPVQAQNNVTRYVRYSYQGATSYGELVGETVHQLTGDLFASPRRTGQTARLADVRLLAPVEPSKVIAVGLNYRSHLGNRPVASTRACSPSTRRRSWAPATTS